MIKCWWNNYLHCALSAHVLCMHDGPRDHAQKIGPYCYLHLWGRWVGGWTLTPCREVHGRGWCGASEYSITCKSTFHHSLWHVHMCWWCAVLCGAHSQVYPEGGSKEIKEESCHHSRQALTVIERILGWKCFTCAISNSSLSHTTLLS